MKRPTLFSVTIASIFLGLCFSACTRKADKKISLKLLSRTWTEAWYSEDKVQIETMVAQFQKDKVLKEMYLIELERGRLCNSAALDRLTLAGGAAGIDDLGDHYYLLDIVNCLSLKPVIFCNSKNEERHTRCVRAYWQSILAEAEGTPGRLASSIRAIEKSPYEPQTDAEQTLSLSALEDTLVSLRVRNASLIEVREQEAQKCRESAGAACVLVTEIAAVQNGGRAAFKEIVPQLDRFPKTKLYKPAVELFRAIYPEIWKN